MQSSSLLDVAETSRRSAVARAAPDAPPHEVHPSCDLDAPPRHKQTPRGRDAKEEESKIALKREPAPASQVGLAARTEDGPAEGIRRFRSTAPAACIQCFAQPQADGLAAAPTLKLHFKLGAREVDLDE